MDLGHELVTAPGAHPERAILWLHGILGSGQNLRTVARRFVLARPRWLAVLVDLPWHGGSRRWAGEATLAAVAEPIVELTRSLPGPARAVLGHSFGGKVAIEVARRVPGSIEHLVSVDSPPGARPPVRDDDGALAVIDMLRELPATFPSKTAFIDAIVARGRPRPLAQWLAQSTRIDPSGEVRFALDLEAIRALVLDYFAADCWPFVEGAPEPLRVHFVIGDRSGAWSSEERARARALAAMRPRVSIDVLPTDHWVHAEDPDGLVRVLLDRIAA